MNDIKLNVSAGEFFQEKISAASKHLGIEFDQHVEFYIVNLLCEFVAPDKINAELEIESDIFNTPLALILKKAVEAPESRQPNLYKRLGDASLYITGFFQDYFNRKTFDINYYVSLGSAAYGQASTLYRTMDQNDARAATLRKLSDQFVKAVDVVAEVSDASVPKDQTSMLSIYDRWVRCQSSVRLRHILEENGIQPIPVPFKIAQ
jgi:hypothetical protein